MTREEAIDIIKCLAWHTRPNEEDVEQAIKALEQEPFINKTCVSEKVCEHDKQMVLDKIRAEIEQLPSTLIDVQRPHSVVERDVVELGSVIRILEKYKVESEE